MEHEAKTPASAYIVDALVKVGIGSHATRDGYLCLTITGALTGVHRFSANISDWRQLAEALRRMAEPSRAVPVPPAAVEPAELEGAAEHAQRAIADWTVGGGSLAALAMATSALIARQVEAESGRAAAIGLFDGLAELVRTAPPLADGDVARRH